MNEATARCDSAQQQIENAERVGVGSARGCVYDIYGRARPIRDRSDFGMVARPGGNALRGAEKEPRVMVDVKPHIFTLHAEKIFCHCHAIHQQKRTPLSTLSLARDLNLDRHVLGSPGFFSSEFRSYRRRPLLGPVLISTLLGLIVVFLRVRKA